MGTNEGREKEGVREKRHFHAILSLSLEARN
jgi:hypothetical protein